MQPSGPTSSKSPQQAAAEGSTSQTVDFPTPALLVTIKPFTPSLATVLENILTVQFGPLLYFAPLPSFARCLAILSSRDKATAAKDFLTHGHWHLESSSQTRVYYYQIDADDPMCTRKDFLKLPQNERLWLISPPGSPPVDWAQEREDPPNAIHLHDELHAALVDLGNGRYHLNYHEDDDNDAEVGVENEDPANRFNTDQGCVEKETISVSQAEPLTNSIEGDLGSTNATSKFSRRLPAPFFPDKPRHIRPTIVIESWEDPELPSQSSSCSNSPLPKTVMPKFRIQP